MNILPVQLRISESLEQADILNSIEFKDIIHKIKQQLPANADLSAFPEDAEFDKLASALQAAKTTIETFIIITIQHKKQWDKRLVQQIAKLLEERMLHNPKQLEAQINKITEQLQQSIPPLSIEDNELVKTQINSLVNSQRELAKAQLVIKSKIDIFNYQPKDRSLSLYTRDASIFDGALFLTDALNDRLRDDPQFYKLAQQTKELLTRLKHQNTYSTSHDTEVYTSADAQKMREDLLQPSALSIALALKPLLQHPQVGFLDPKIDIQHTLKKILKTLDIAESFYLATQPRPAIISISKAPRLRKTDPVTLMAQMDVPIDIFNEDRINAYLAVKKDNQVQDEGHPLTKEIQAIKAKNLADINLTSRNEVVLPPSGFFSKITRFFNSFIKWLKGGSSLSIKSARPDWFGQLLPLHQLLAKKMVDKGDIYTLPSRLDLTLPIPRNFGRHTFIGKSIVHHIRGSHPGSRAGEAESITPEQALQSAVARIEETTLIQAYEAAKRAYAASNLKPKAGEEIIVEGQGLLFQSLITPKPILNREPDKTLAQHERDAIDALQKKYAEEGVPVNLDGITYRIKFKVFNTNYCQNIGRAIDFTKNGEYAQQSRAFCKFVEEDVLRARLANELEQAQNLWGQKPQDKALYYGVEAAEEKFSLLGCKSYAEFQHQLYTCKYPVSDDLRIILSALYQQEELLNASYTSIIASYSLNREMHLAGLEIFLARRAGILPVSFCVSGKDREQLCTNYADAIEAYYSITGNLPRFDDDMDENNHLFAEIQAMLFLSQHGAMVAATNAWGAEGIKTPYIYLPSLVQKKIIQLSGNADILKLSEQLAKNNDIHKLLDNKFMGNIMQHLLNARLRNADVLNELAIEQQAEALNQPAEQPPVDGAKQLIEELNQGAAIESGQAIQHNNMPANADIEELNPPAFAVSSRLEHAFLNFKTEMIRAISEKQHLAQAKGMPLLSKRGGKVIKVDGKMWVLPSQLADTIKFVDDSLAVLKTFERDPIWLSNTLMKANHLMQETQRKSLEDSSFRTPEAKDLYATVLVDGLLNLNVNLYDTIERIETLTKPQPHAPISMANCAFAAKRAARMSNNLAVEVGAEEAEINERLAMPCGV